ncbi:hypothetical protein BKA61DRAFT_679533 [Leptodontidium sp. MPI-SDFR-AT-0119]|nr:hypothetical protein BKA61DRAFT_679533 [Leptodontidium sp. MPI-SDFR-AT-0119]
MEYTSNNRRTRIPTLREWVAMRFDRRDFNHNPVVGPDVLEPWSLDLDLLSYQIMLETRSRRQAVEFIELWRRVRESPVDLDMIYDDRQWRDRRELYGLDRDPSPEMARVEAVWRDAREEERRVSRVNMDIPVHGDPVQDVAELAEIHEGILRLCWSCLMLNMPFTAEQQQRVEDFTQRRRAIHSRIDHDMLDRRRGLFTTQDIADRARELHRDQVLQRAVAEWEQREQEQTLQMRVAELTLSECETETASESSQQAPSSESPSEARSFSTSSPIQRRRASQELTHLGNTLFGNLNDLIGALDVSSDGDGDGGLIYRIRHRPANVRRWVLNRH